MKKVHWILFTVAMLALVACSSEPVEVTRIIENDVEVTRIVEVEITRIIEVEHEIAVVEEVEVTRIVEVEVEVEVTAVPTETPAPTETPMPTATVAVVVPQATAVPAVSVTSELLTAANNVRSNMQSFGGMIDNAMRTGFVDCQKIIDTYDAVAFAPTFNVTDPNLASAYGSYRAAIALFTDGTRDMTGNCRELLNGSNGSIPFQQWGLARQTVGEAGDILQPAILALGGE
jgi:hypothetical protein